MQYTVDVPLVRYGLAENFLRRHFFNKVRILVLTRLISLEAKHLIWVWIMKVKEPKHQADFIKVLYVVVYAWGATF